MEERVRDLVSKDTDALVWKGQVTRGTREESLVNDDVC